MADITDYTKIPVSVSNQKALWKKVNDTFAGAAATDEDFMAYITDTTTLGSVYVLSPASDKEFLDYVFGQAQA